jgi:hypothetical protein
VTAVALLRFVPSIVTAVPAGPEVGEKPVIVVVGVVVTVNGMLLVAVPFGVVTPIGPLVALAGTVAVIWLSETTVNADAAVPLKVTPVAPERFVPWIETSVPPGPLVGENPEIDGPGVTTVIVKVLALNAVPVGVVTLTAPLLAPLGTVASI